MSKIFTGILPDEAIELLHTYVDSDLPDVVIESLQGMGIKGKLAHTAVLPEIELVILDDDLWNTCKAHKMRVMDMPKTHHYTTMEDLRNFLIAMFGDKEGTIKTSNVEVTIKDTDLLVSESDSGNREAELLEENAKLRSQLSTSEQMVSNLRTQLAQAEEDSDVSYFVDKIKELETTIEDLQAQVKSAENKGEASALEARRNEGIAKELEETKAQLESLKTEHSSLTFSHKEALNKVSVLEAEVKALVNQMATSSSDSEETAKLRNTILELNKRLKETELDLDALRANKTSLINESVTLHATVEDLRAAVADRDVLEERLSTVEKQYADETQKNSELEATVFQLKKEAVDADALEKSLSLATAKAEELTSEVSTLRSNLKDSAKEVENLRGTVNTLNDKVSAKNDEISKLASSVSELEASTSEKDSNLAKCNSEIKSLTDKTHSLHSELESAQATISGFEQRIEELESDLSKADRVIASLKEENQNASTRAAELSAENTAIRDEINTYKNKISTLNSQVSALQTDLVKTETSIRDGDVAKSRVSELEDKLRQCKVTLEETLTRAETSEKKVASLNDQLTALNLELESERTAANEMTTSLKEKVKLLTDKLTEIRTEVQSSETSLTDANNKISELSDELQTAKSDLERERSKSSFANSELTKAVERIEALEKSIAGYKSTISALQEGSSDAEELKRQLSAKDNRTTDLEKALEEARTKLTEEQRRVSELQIELSDASTKTSTAQTLISSLQEDLSTAQASLADKEAEVARVRRECDSLKTASSGNKVALETKSKEIVRLNESIGELNSSLSEKTIALEKSNATIRRLEAELADISNTVKTATTVGEIDSEETRRLKATVESLELQIKTAEGIAAEHTAEIQGYQDKISKLMNELSAASEKERLGNNALVENSQLKSSVASLDKRVTDLQAKVATQRQELTSKESEIERLKASRTDNDLISKLQARVTECEADLASAKDSLDDERASSSARIDFLEDETSNLREKLSACEADNKALGEHIEELTSSVFMAMAESAMPKSGIALEVQTPKTHYKNMFVFASGSSESDASLYSLISRQIKMRNTKSYLVVDLSRNTYVDRELGVSKVASPIGWLQGADSPTNYLVSTKYENAKLLATSLSYINELFYLSVDWTSRLDELASLADVVIINVGTLGSAIPDILYNSFTRVMRGHVIVKSTPISLRTTILHLSGLTNIKNTLVSCVSPSATSEKLYSPLAAKWKAQVLQDKDLLIL